jgi:hypothetical protein
MLLLRIFVGVALAILAVVIAWISIPGIAAYLAGLALIYGWFSTVLGISGVS